MRINVLLFAISGVLGFYTGCYSPSLPNDVEMSLALANDSGLRRLLLDYQQNDEERFEAACFLIANAKWHKFVGGTSCYDNNIEKIIQRTDSLCFSSFQAKFTDFNDTFCLKSWLSDTLNHNEPKACEFNVPKLCPNKLVTDIEVLDSAFVSEQIEYAFDLRDRYEHVKRLSFDDFCEYVLPYRGVSDFPFLYTNEQLANHFSAFLNQAGGNASAAVVLYNNYLKWVNAVNGNYPLAYSTGLPELLFKNKRNCVDKVHFATLALRSAGFPMAIEFNMAYRAAPFRHFMCALLDVSGEFMPFNAEKGIPEKDNSRFVSCLNIYRLSFSAQSNTPYFMRGEDEYLPVEFYSPCIKDVSEEYLEVVALDLPLNNVDFKNKLVYLATINTHGMLTPVTWGLVEGQQVNFKKVIPDQIYFPIVYNQWGRQIPVAKPFVLRSGTGTFGNYRIEPLNDPTGVFVDVELRRKYPRKPHLEVCARTAVGIVVLGSNCSGFSDADTISVIERVPDTYWEDLSLSCKKKYKYYRIVASNMSKTLPLSEICFGKSNHAGEFVQISELISKHPEVSDGNVQTTTEKPFVDFFSENAVSPTHLRYMIKHADNTIVPGHQYRLYEWSDEQGWSIVWDKKSEGYSICAEHLEIGRLYWLSDVTEGVEEMPFVVNKDGSVDFTHDWILEDTYLKTRS